MAGGTGVALDTDSTTKLAQIEPIALEAGELLRARFGRPGEVNAKGPGGAGGRVTDLVTEVDYACERLVLDRIREVAPDAVVLAEEGGAARLDGTDLVGGLEEIDDLWLVDPLDGTVNFAYGLPLFCVSIARYSRGVPVAGVVHAPMLDETYAFAAGEAPTLNGEPVRVAEREHANEGVVALSGLGEHFRELARRFIGWRRLGSAALTLCWVGAGRLDCYVQAGPLSPWDHAAGAPFAIAAGASACHLDFEPWSYPLTGVTSVVIGAPAAHEMLVGLLREHDA